MAYESKIEKVTVKGRDYLMTLDYDDNMNPEYRLYNGSGKYIRMESSLMNVLTKSPLSLTPEQAIEIGKGLTFTERG